MYLYGCHKWRAGQAKYKKCILLNYNLVRRQCEWHVKICARPLLHLIWEMYNENILIQGVPKVWYPLRNCWSKCRRSTKFGDCNNKTSINFPTIIRGPGPFERPQTIGTPPFFMETCTLWMAYYWTGQTHILIPQTGFCVGRFQNEHFKCFPIM